MKIKASNLQGKKIIAQYNNKKLDDIDDFILNNQGSEVVGLVLSSGSILSSEKKIVLFKNLSSVEEKKVQVDNANVIRKVEDFNQFGRSFFNGEKAITGSIVVSTEGEKMGKINDFEFDTQTGKVISFLIGKNVMAKILSIDEEIEKQKVLSLGKEVMFVNKNQTGQSQAKQNGQQSQGQKNRSGQGKSTRQTQPKQQQNKKAKNQPPEKQEVQTRSNKETVAIPEDSTIVLPETKKTGVVYETEAPTVLKKAKKGTEKNE